MMRPAAIKYVLPLLVKVYNQTITDYFYFPEIIYAGPQKIERADFELLLSEGLISFTKFDSFGRYYQLSKRGQDLLHQHSTRQQRRKAPAVPLIQGCLYFNRFNNPHAKGARCLLFL